ncbi:MAG TPA: hypothetical protein VEA61_09060 [Allosphingosinicella sp.]|nr:hypothetical protein [Allosphingosinicella sp.]
MRRLGRAAGWTAAALLAGCAGKPPPAPAPAVRPVAVPAPATPAPPPADWTDAAPTPGDWRYSDGEARFAGFGLRCDRARRQVVLSRDGTDGAIRVRTSYGDRTLASGAALAAGDPLLDEIAFSRGRFAVEAEGTDALVIPAWPEPARVVEDCRT